MDGRTLRLLHFRREHPEVQVALATPTPGPAPIGLGISSITTVVETTHVTAITDEEFTPTPEPPTEFNDL
jgi:hypothetical protein